MKPFLDYSDNDKTLEMDLKKKKTYSVKLTSRVRMWVQQQGNELVLDGHHNLAELHSEVQNPTELYSNSTFLKRIPRTSKCCLRFSTACRFNWTPRSATRKMVDLLLMSPLGRLHLPITVVYHRQWLEFAQITIWTNPKTWECKPNIWECKSAV